MNVVKVDENIYEFGKVPKEEYLEYFHYKNPVKLSEDTYRVDALGERLPAVTVIEKDAPEPVKNEETGEIDASNFEDQMAFFQKLFEEMMSRMRLLEIESEAKLNSYHAFLKERGLLKAFEKEYGGILMDTATVAEEEENSLKEPGFEELKESPVRDREAVKRIKIGNPDGELYEMTQRELDQFMDEQDGVFEFENVHFVEVTFEKNHERIVQMKNCRLYECKLNGFPGEGMDLEASVFTDCAFINTDLKEAKMTGTGLYHCRFQNSSLERADLSNASVKHTFFDETELTEAILTQASMETVYLRNAIVENAPVGLGTVHFSMGGATNDELENMKQQVYHALNRGENAVGILHAYSRFVRVDGHEGTWRVIGKTFDENESLYLLESETEGDVQLILDEKGKLRMEDVPNGFLDYWERRLASVDFLEVKTTTAGEETEEAKGKIPEEQQKQKKIGMKR